MKSAKILEGRALTTVGGDSDAQEMNHFQKILKHNQNIIFGDAKYQLNMSRQERLRLPSRLPMEESINALKQYTVKRIRELCEAHQSQMSKTDFVELRNLTCSRLTLFNARRTGSNGTKTLDS